MRISRRTFGVSALAIGVAACDLMRSGNTITGPTQPATPTGPISIPTYPSVVTFTHDGKTSTAQRIGDVHTTGMNGTLVQIMEATRLIIPADVNNLGLVTRFDSVKPGLGLIFLVNGDRFTSRAHEVPMTAGQTYAGYEWRGFNPTPLNALRLFLNL